MENVVEVFKLLLEDNSDIALIEAFKYIFYFQERTLNDFVKNYRDRLIKKYPIDFISIHVQYYLDNDNVQKALEVLNYYQNSPFISIEVEEFMKELHDSIINNNKKRKKIEYDEDLLREHIFSSNDDLNVNAINYLQTANIRNYLNLVTDILDSDIKYDYKVILIFILIDQGVNREFKVKNKEEEFVINPTKLSFPFDQENYKKITKEIDKLNDDPDTINTMKEVLNTYQIMAFPHSLFDNYDEDFIIKGLKLYACELLSKDYEDLVENLSREEIKAFADFSNEIEKRTA